MPFGPRRVEVLEGLLDAADGSHYLAFGGRAQDRTKLIAPYASDDIGGAHASIEHAGDADQGVITGLVALEVIDRLQVIHVTEQHEESGLLSVRHAQAMSTEREESRTVRDTGQLVDGRSLEHVHLSLDRVREIAEQSNVIVRQRPWNSVDDAERTDRVMLRRSDRDARIEAEPWRAEY